MKRISFFLIAVSVLCGVYSCRPVEQKEVLRSGDLLFVSLPLGFDLGISADSVGRLVANMSDTAQLQCIHVSIIEMFHDTAYVIDATAKRGVARYPLDTLLKDFTLNGGYCPRYDVLRVNAGEDGERYVANAKAYIGQPYDFDFRLNNDAKYCSELVYDAYKTSEDAPLFALGEMDFTEGRGVLTDYWTHLFQWFGCNVPQGSGVLPCDLKRSPLLKGVPVKISEQ